MENYNVGEKWLTDLRNDVWGIILSYLEVKSLFSCLLVCKRLNSYVSEAKFVKPHLWRMISSSPSNNAEEKGFPRPRRGVSMVMIKDKLYIYGGYSGSEKGHLNDLWSFDLQTNKWEMIDDFFGEVSSPTSFQSMVVISDDRLLIFGGYSPSYGNLDTFKVFIPEEISFFEPKITGPTPSPRESCACVLMADGYRTIFWGGLIKEEESLNDCFILDTRDWKCIEAEQTGDIPLPRFGASLTMMDDGSFILFGGKDSWNGSTHFDDTYRGKEISLGVIHWKKISTLNAPPARRHHSAIFLQGNLTVFGGMVNGSFDQTDDIWTFDPKLSNWTKDFICPLNSTWSRYGHGCVSIKGDIIMFQGSGKEGLGPKGLMGDLTFLQRFGAQCPYPCMTQATVFPNHLPSSYTDITNKK